MDGYARVDGEIMYEVNADGVTSPVTVEELVKRANRMQMVRGLLFEGYRDYAARNELLQYPARMVMFTLFVADTGMQHTEDRALFAEYAEWLYDQYTLDVEVLPAWSGHR